MPVVAIMANGPADHIPDLRQYKEEVDIWIGADRGALRLAKNDINIHYALGDFDSIDAIQKNLLMDKVVHFEEYPIEKDETDLEIALQAAFTLQPEKIYLFGVTGGRLDHALINMQLLHTIVEKNIRGIIVDRWNQLELTKTGSYKVDKSKQYPHISFIPFTKDVRNLTLDGFYYPLTGADISWGSTRCISNKLVSSTGTFSYSEGMLLLVKSCDADSSSYFF